MVRDLKQRFVDGLILVLAASHRGARARARAGGGAGDRDRHAAEGHARRHRAAALAARRGRGGPPPVTPSADGGSRSSTGRSRRCRARARRLGYLDGLRSCGLERDERSASSPTTSRSSRAAAPPSAARARERRTRSSAPTTCSRSARSPRCAMPAFDVPQRRRGRGDGQHRALRADVAGAHERRPRLGRARAHRGRAAVQAHRRSRRASPSRSASSRVSSCARSIGAGAPA